MHPNKHWAQYTIFNIMKYCISNIDNAYQGPRLIVLLRLILLVILISQGQRIKRNGWKNQTKNPDTSVCRMICIFRIHSFLIAKVFLLSIVLDGDFRRIQTWTYRRTCNNNSEIMAWLLHPSKMDQTSQITNGHIKLLETMEG